MKQPDTRYAWNGDIALAYQVIGDGPPDLVYLQGWISNVELNWESPYLARFLRGLASLGRLVVSDVGDGAARTVSRRATFHHLRPSPMILGS